MVAIVNSVDAARKLQRVGKLRDDFDLSLEETHH
jgi:hypothetical protein